MNRGNGNVNRGGGRRGNFNRGGGGGGPPNQSFVNGRPVRTLGGERDRDEELLMLVNSEFQIFCTDSRSLDDIYDRVRQNSDLHNYIYQKKDGLRKFIEGYGENFLIDPANPNIVKWLKQRVVSKNDRKERFRRERRDWAKGFEEEGFPYDLVYEENVLSFVTALFLTTKESWLKMATVETAVKQALTHEADLQDYAASNVRNFLIKRDHMFKEHLEQVHFYGATAYNVVYKLNQFIRESYQGECRETVRRLHEHYLTFDDFERDEMKMDDRKDFENFLLRCTFVFAYKWDDTHVTSKRVLPVLAFSPQRLTKEFNEVVDLFGQVHKKYEKVDDNVTTYELDETDDGLVPIVDPRGTRPAPPAGSQCSTGSSSGGPPASENPFEKRRAKATGQKAENPFESTLSSRAARNSAANKSVDLNPFLRTPGADN